MDQWIEYYDSAHTIYVSELHRDVHFKVIAREIIGYIPSASATVLDYSCGEALSASQVADACGRLILAEPAPSLRARLAARFANDPKIEVRSLDDLAALAPRSVDLAVMNSVAQYMTRDELRAALAMIRRLLKPGGTLVVGDIIRPDSGMVPDILALLRFGYRNGFLKDALTGLVTTALSDYRKLRSSIGLQTYTEAELMTLLNEAGFNPRRSGKNIGHNPARMTFVALPDCSHDSLPELTLNDAI
ncbi:MAG TPA: class I SAM-dependent methyltransferase [Xanthobacteraceae bacterium]|nr:class I SAM-dependent methyltransferase [Xanthobacteraceae bacterium]